MMQTMYWVSPHNTVNEPFVLRRMRQDRLVVMDEYRDLVCGKCGKVNEKAALERGIQPEVIVKSKRPFLPSGDDFYLVDRRAKDVFSTVLPNGFEYYRIPSSTFYVASAKLSLYPLASDSGYEFIGGTCGECGRSKEVYLGKVAPTIMQQNRFVSVILEGRQGAREIWLVSKDVAQAFEDVSPRLTGMVLAPMEVNDGRTWR